MKTAGYRHQPLHKIIVCIAVVSFILYKASVCFMNIVGILLTNILLLMRNVVEEKNIGKNMLLFW